MRVGEIGAAIGPRGPIAATGFAATAALLLLAACVAPRAKPDIAAPSPAPAMTLPSPPQAIFVPPAPPADDARMSCVPYARAVTGLDLHGDAWIWWDAAAGRYARGSAPEPYAVLVLTQGVRLKYGHLAVVRAVFDRRRVQVDQANWNGDERIVKGMTVVDVSAANDWTEVRFWNGQAGTWGNVYLAYGFIYPPGTEPGGAATALAP